MWNSKRTNAPRVFVPCIVQPHHSRIAKQGEESAPAPLPPPLPPLGARHAHETRADQGERKPSLALGTRCLNRIFALVDGALTATFLMLAMGGSWGLQ